jgi:hypothetical protein
MMQEDKDQIIKLTSNLYRLTLFFPKKEPLRYKIREVATSFLASPNKKDLAVLDSFFDISLAQNWVSPNDILRVKEDYSKLASIFDPREEPKSMLPEVIRELSYSNDFNPESSLTDRQSKIVDFLKQNGKAQVWQLKQLLPEVTKRTLRRDFEGLLHGGKIERVGERNDTFYQLKTYTD